MPGQVWRLKFTDGKITAEIMYLKKQQVAISISASDFLCFW